MTVKRNECKNIIFIFFFFFQSTQVIIEEHVMVKAQKSILGGLLMNAKAPSDKYTYMGSKYVI